MKNDYIPENEAWLVFDLCNGHKGSHQYVWWFRTRNEARNHIIYIKNIKHYAELSAPQKWVKSQ